jgi:hypothetical protein
MLVLKRYTSDSYFLDYTICFNHTNRRHSLQLIPFVIFSLKVTIQDNKMLASMPGRHFTFSNNLSIQTYIRTFFFCRQHIRTWLDCVLMDTDQESTFALGTFHALWNIYIEAITFVQITLQSSLTLVPQTLLTSCLRHPLCMLQLRWLHLARVSADLGKKFLEGSCRVDHPSKGGVIESTL